MAVINVNVNFFIINPLSWLSLFLLTRYRARRVPAEIIIANRPELLPIHK
jgi:hypothetical protein